MTAALIVLMLSLGQAQDPAALSAAALEMAQEKRFDEAEKQWLRALAVSPGLFSAAFNLGFMYHSQQQYTKAEPLLARAAKSQPKDFNARFLHGSTLQQLGRRDQALREWRAALALRPDHFKLMQIMAVEYGKGQYFREAAAIAERALRLQEDDPNLYLAAIKSYQDAADHPSALRIAERMAGKFPRLPRASFEYGYELYRAGRRDAAMPYLKNAMDADEAYEEPFFFYGELLVKEGRHEEAIAPLRRAIALRRDYMAAWVMLARALMSLERHEEARTELLRAIEIDPGHPQPHLQLSQLYFRLGDEAAAAREKELSLRLRRDNPQAMESLQGRPFPQ